jgi:hypothetical protein
MSALTSGNLWRKVADGSSVQLFQRERKAFIRRTRRGRLAMKRAALSDLPPMLLNKEGKNHLGFVSDGWNLFNFSM